MGKSHGNVSKKKSLLIDLNAEMPTRAKTETKLDMMLAYFAGIVDGEGTIQIVKQGSRKPNYLTTGFYITNSHMGLLKSLQAVFGGHITKARQHVRRNWKPVYRLQFHGSLSEDLVRLIQPYLIVKQEQAELFLTFRARVGCGEHPLSVGERDLRYALYERCRAANVRGIGQAERLSEATPRKEDDTIVRSAANEEAAEAGRNVQPAVVH